MGKVTIRDLADQLGLAKSSVSYALNGQPGVSDTTRERVLALAEQLGWHPNSTARALSRSRAGAVGIILTREPTLIGIEPFYMRFIAGIEEVLARSEDSLVFRIAPQSADQELAIYRRWSAERRVDGVILVDQLVDDPRPPLLADLGLPTVLYSCQPSKPRFPSVFVSERSTGIRCIAHYAALGHRHVGHVLGPDAFVHENARESALVDAAAAHGIGISLAAGDYSIDAGRRGTLRLLRQNRRPTAIGYSNDIMAIGGLRAVQELGLRVPEDVSLLSWDDSMLCQQAAPSLTAFGHDPAEGGRRSAELLKELIAGHEPPDVAVPPAGLIQRRSTGPAPD